MAVALDSVLCPWLGPWQLEPLVCPQADKLGWGRQGCQAQIGVKEGPAESSLSAELLPM